MPVLAADKTPSPAPGCGAQTYRLRLTAMNADGSSGGPDVIEVAANDPREAMALVIRRQSGWFTVELLEQSAPANEDQGSVFGREPR